MFLVDNNGHAQVFDGVGVWLGVAWQEVADERAKGFVQLAARFGGNGIENDGRFTRPGYTGKERDFALGNAQRDILQVVFTCAANRDIFLGHNSFIFLSNGPSSPPLFMGERGWCMVLRSQGFTKFEPPEAASWAFQSRTVWRTPR